MVKVGFLKTQKFNKGVKYFHPYGELFSKSRLNVPQTTNAASTTNSSLLFGNFATYLPIGQRVRELIDRAIAQYGSFGVALCATKRKIDIEFRLGRKKIKISSDIRE